MLWYYVNTIAVKYLFVTLAKQLNEAGATFDSDQAFAIGADKLLNIEQCGQVCKHGRSLEVLARDSAEVLTKHLRTKL